jgi:hypothetical protein
VVRLNSVRYSSEAKAMVCERKEQRAVWMLLI